MIKPYVNPTVPKKSKLHPTVIKKAAKILIESDEERGRTKNKKEQQQTVQFDGQKIFIVYKYTDEICKIKFMKRS